MRCTGRKYLVLRSRPDLGQIHNAAFKCNRGIPNLLSHLKSVSPSNGCYRFDLVAQGRCFDLLLPDATSFGVLNEQVADALQNVIDVTAIQLEGVATVEIWTEVLNLASKARKFVFNIDINVYGSKSVRDIVGKNLSTPRTYLQHPTYDIHGFEYDNPHFLNLPGVDTPYTITIPTSAAPQASTRSSLHSSVSELYRSLRRSKCLKELEVDVRIRTPLLA